MSKEQGSQQFLIIGQQHRPTIAMVVLRAFRVYLFQLIRVHDKGVLNSAPQPYITVLYCLKHFSFNLASVVTSWQKFCIRVDISSPSIVGMGWTYTCDAIKGDGKMFFITDVCWPLLHIGVPAKPSFSLGSHCGLAAVASDHVHQACWLTCAHSLWSE